MIAVSESTPGPIMVNLATYVGSSQAGILGGLIATFAVVLPAFVIILLIMIVLNKLIDNKYVKAILGGLKPCVMGIILAMGSYMILQNSISPLFQKAPDLWAPIIAVILSVLLFGSKYVLKKKCLQSY